MVSFFVSCSWQHLHFRCIFFSVQHFFYFSKCIGGGTGRGFSLSPLHTQTERNWVGTHQSQKTEQVWESNQVYGGRGSSIRDWGTHMWILGNGNGGKIGDTKYYSWGETDHI